MEALILFIIPLIIYIFIKVMIWRDVDVIAIDKKKFAEGIQFFEAQNIEACVNYFDAMIISNPKSSVAYYYRGLANAKLGNVYVAIYNFEKSSNLSNELTDVFYQKALMLYQISDFEYALKELNRAAHIYRDSHPEVYQLRAKVHQALQNSILATVDEQKAENIISRAVAKK